MSAGACDRGAESTKQRWQKRLKRLALLLISPVLALLLAEMVVRVVSPQGLRTPIRTSSDGLIVMRASLEGRFCSPGEYDTTFRTNAQRFRASGEYALEPAPGVCRIVALGDSFTFGTGVEDDQTFPALLEARLNARREGPRVEVLNAGVHGCGTGNQALWFDRGLKQFRPDILVLTIYANDLVDEIQGARFVLDERGSAIPLSDAQLEALDKESATIQQLVTMLPGYDYLCAHSHLLALARTVATLTLLGRREEGIRALWDEHGVADVIELQVAETRWLAERAAECGADFVAVYVPEQEFFTAGPQAERVVLARRHVERLAEVSAAAKFPFLDLSGPIGVHRETHGSPYFERDIHFRVEGNELIAEEIAKLLETNERLK